MKVNKRDSFATDKFDPGETVRVRSFEEIKPTLDSRGTLDGLPFMSEMIPYCGQMYVVLCKVRRTCVEGCKPFLRLFRGDDVYLLDTVECNGQAHDGCEKCCLIFWKAKWLERLPAHAETQPLLHSDEQIESIFPKVDEKGRYFCQSTQLQEATVPFSKSRQYYSLFSDLFSDAYPLKHFAWAICSSFSYKLRKLTRHLYWQGGELKKTPTENLGIQPGDWVEVRSLKEISQTVDALLRNRGLGFTRYMFPYCGKRFQVKRKLNRIILETTGEMRELKNTVLLHDNVCNGFTCTGACPRKQYNFWREIWLRRSDSRDRKKRLPS